MKFTILALVCSTALLAIEPFVSAEKLSEILPKGNVVLIDVGTPEDYFKAGHIPGAVNTKISDWRMPVEKHFLMRPTEELTKKVSELGIKNNSTVVIYGHNQPKEILKASYVALVLKTLGHKEVSILNGGFGEWTFDPKRPVSKTNEMNQPSVYVSDINKNILVDREFILAHMNKIPMIEARPADFYYGMVESEGVKRKGHIPGAASYFWKNSLESDETIKPVEELTDILIKGMQLDPKKEMLVYCTGGLEASMNWYVLTQVLKFQDVKIYDASLKEWGNRDDTPMITYRWESCKK